MGAEYRAAFLLDQASVPDRFTDYESYDVSGWDGYDADPITADTLRVARHFAQSLPRHVPSSDIAPGADGTIGFEWRIGRHSDVVAIFVEVGPGDNMGAFKERNGSKEIIVCGRVTSNMSTVINELLRLTHERA